MQVRVVGVLSDGCPEWAVPPGSLLSRCRVCERGLWVTPQSLRLVEAGAMACCVECARLAEALSQPHGIIPVCEHQLEGFVRALRQRREIVRSN